jgi:hypothetical protein
MFHYMDWQQSVSLGIVGVTAAILLKHRVKPRKFSFQRDTHCGCHAASQHTPQNSIVFRARKGERPQVFVKMK